MLLKNKIENLLVLTPLLRIFSLTLLVVLFFVSHIPKLGTDEINPDAINWHSRSEQYIDAIKSRDFRRTYQHYHPGVTLMLITGVPTELLKRSFNPKLEYSNLTYEGFHFVAKYTLNMVLLLLIVFLVFGLTKIIGFKIAYLTGIFLTLDPFFLGNSRLLHMDALLSLFVASTLVCFYLSYKFNSNKWLIMTGIFGGLAVWTKGASIVVIAFVFICSLLLFIFKKIKFKKMLTVFLKKAPRSLDFLGSASPKPKRKRRSRA